MKISHTSFPFLEQPPYFTNPSFRENFQNPPPPPGPRPPPPPPPPAPHVRACDVITKWSSNVEKSLYLHL